MVLIDVNVLVYAHREDAHEHERYREWLESLANSPVPFAIADLAFAGFMRIVTHPQVFSPPSSLRQATAFVEALRAQANFVPITPGERHWGIFSALCEASGAKGNLIPDAYFAAMAIESGCEWITTDGDYARFPGLRWRHPLK